MNLESLARREQSERAIPSQVRFEINYAGKESRLTGITLFTLSTHLLNQYIQPLTASYTSLFFEFSLISLSAILGAGVANAYGRTREAKKQVEKNKRVGKEIIYWTYSTQEPF